MAVNKVIFGAVSIMDISDSTVTADTLAKGATAYDKSGEKITGTMEAKADSVLQSKTVTPTTSKQSVTPDSGYDGLSDVTVNAMPTGAMSEISVSSSGVITSQIGTSGYLASGTKKTKSLTTQSAKTVTPTTSNQTAVASGRYTTGAVTVKGDSNLIAGNIKKGTSIFGVTGTYEGSGGLSGGGSVETANITLSLSSCTYYATVFEDGIITAQTDIVNYADIANVVLGSVVVLMGSLVEYAWFYGATLLYSDTSVAYIRIDEKDVYVEGGIPLG